MSNHIPLFAMNRCTSVEKLEENRLLSVCRLRDTETAAEVRLSIALPGLEIIAAEAVFSHSRLNPPADLEERLARLAGVRVGSGMLKIISGLLGEEENCRQLVYMVEECCHGVILSLTRRVLEKAPDDEAGRFAFYANMVKKSIRLYDRCAAFAKGGRLVREYEKELGGGKP